MYDTIKISSVTDNIRLWSPSEALESYGRAGGRITEPTSFGVDPIQNNANLEIRQRAFLDLKY